MATWHQAKARSRLYHETEWSVVTDPPGQCTSIVTWSTEELAEAYVERLKALGKAEHTYILKPANQREG